MSELLRIGVVAGSGEAFELPLDAVTRTFAVLGQRGTGKTTGAVDLVEEMVGAGGHVAVLDPVGAWWGITHAGSGPGLEGIVIGGEHGDVPLEETGGELVAELVVARHYPLVVIDLKLLRKGAQLRFMADYCEALFHLNREALHHVFEEADRPAPQASRERDVNAMRLLGAVEDIVKLGRSRGLGATLVTQRPATLNKNVLEVCENLLLFRLMGPNDRKAARAWIEANGDPVAEKAVMDTLASLDVGQCWFYSPAWLRRLERVDMRPRSTFDSSATPEVGRVVAAPTERTPVDLEELRQRMAATIEKAEAQDPKKLRERIQELERQLEAISNKPPDATQMPAACDHGPIIEELSGRSTRLYRELQEAKESTEKMALELARERSAIDAVVAARRNVAEILLGANPDAKEASKNDTTHARGNAVAASEEPRRDYQHIEQRARSGDRGSANPGGTIRRAIQSTRRTEDMTDEEVRELIAQEVARAVAAIPGAKVYVPAAEVLRKDYQQRAVERMLQELDELSADEREALRFLLGQGARFVSVGELSKALSGYVGGSAQVKWGTATKGLAKLGLTKLVERQGSMPAVREFVASLLAPHTASEEEVESVYQAVLGRIAGEGVVTR